MDKIRIQFTLFSAFYSPLISAMSGGFLEGGRSRSGVVDFAAGRLGACGVEGWLRSRRSIGAEPGIHVARSRGRRRPRSISRRSTRWTGSSSPDARRIPTFTWGKLEGAEVVMFKGGQPIAMFKYACYKAGIDFNKIRPICPGGAAEIDQAFRRGEGQYVQQQGPFPQQLQADGIGHIVAQVGKQIGPCGFSSLAATRDWLETDMARAFMRAYRKTRIYMNETPASEIAKAEKPYFPGYRRRACSPIASQRISSLAAGRRMWKLRMRPMKERWMSSSTSAC